MSNHRIEKVTAAIAFIEAHLTEKLELDTVASAVHYSKYHLHRVFAKTVGLTIHDYVQRRQLTEAAKLLVFSERSIIEIATLAGYETQQAFTTIFTAMYQESPSQYRGHQARGYAGADGATWGGSGVLSCANRQGQLEKTRERMATFLQGGGVSLGILLKTNSAAKELYDLLSQEYEVQLISPDSTRFINGISISSIQMSKGL